MRVRLVPVCITCDFTGLVSSGGCLCLWLFLTAKKMNNKRGKLLLHKGIWKRYSYSYSTKAWRTRFCAVRFVGCMVKATSTHSFYQYVIHYTNTKSWQMQCVLFVDSYVYGTLNGVYIFVWNCNCMNKFSLIIIIYVYSILNMKLPRKLHDWIEGSVEKIIIEHNIYLLLIKAFKTLNW